MTERVDGSLVGHDVYSSDGAQVGKIEKIVDQDGKAAFLHIRDSGHFGIGAQHFLVPVSEITSTENGQVHVNRTREQLEGIPAHDENEAHDPEYFESLYTWWGRANQN